MLNLKRLCFAAVAVTLGSSALAQVNGPNEGPSDVFLAVWNPNTNQSIVQDLGITEAQFLATDSGTQNYTIDNTSAAFQSALSITGGNTSGDLMIVFAGNAVGALLAGTNFNGNELDFSSAVSPSSLINNNVVSSAASAVGSYIDNTMVNPGNSLVVAAGASNSNYWAKSPPGGNPGATLGGGSSMNGTAGAIGSSLNYYTAIAAGPDDSGTDSPNVTKLAGAWSLSNTGTLTWTAASSGPTTPLPAAVWMFLSGLLGLGTVSRRKAA